MCPVQIGLPDFRQRWNNERRKEPYAVYVSNREQSSRHDPRPGCSGIEDPIRAGDDVVIRFTPIGRGRPYLPLCLVNEILSPVDEMLLTTAVIANEHLFELDVTDSVAVIAYAFLFFYDWARAQQSMESLLLAPRVDVAIEPVSDRVRQHAATNLPWVRLSQVLEFWNHVGQQLAYHYLRPAPESGQRANYTHLPARQ